MPKPQNPLRKNTTVILSKEVNNRIRKYAIKDPKRKGNESTEKILVRVFDYLDGKSNERPTSSDTPVSTYSS